MRITILSALFFLVSLNLTAQADYGNKGEAIQLCKALQGSQFSNYREANSAIEDILSVIGAKNRFVVQPCDNINNAAAVTMQGIRYIFYDPNFLNSISSGRYSSNLFILAHEVGHHINGHSQDIVMLLSDYAPTSNTLSEERIEELEADEFAGFIMGKLGHSLSSMQNTLRGVADNGDDTYSTHPSLSKRLKAVETGYNKARGNEVLKTKVSPSKQRAEEYFYSAFAKDDLGDYTGAIQDYNKAIELDPDFVDAYNNRGIDKHSLGDKIGAIQDYNKAIELDPYKADVYYNRAIAKSRLGDGRGAIQDYNKAIEFDPSHGSAYHNRGGAKFKLEDYIGAIQDYNKAIELDPSHGSAYYLRAVAKIFLGDKEGGCLDLSKAGELGEYEAYNLIKEYCQ